MSSSLLAEVIDIRLWLAEDRDRPLAERLQRDRAIGRELSQAQDVARVRAWWREVQALREKKAPQQESVGSRVVGLSRLAVLVLLVAGVLLGLSVGTVAFGYEGDYPVNLLALLGVLVGIPLVLLVLTLVLLLPGRLPGLSAARDTLAAINPGRWIGAWLDRYSKLRLYAGFASSQSSFSRWQLVVFSQWMAVGFFTGILVVGWLLVAVTDLAFGWSTTLDLEAEVIYRWLNGLSSPWQSWLPVAVPDSDLVAASRFYRLENGAVPIERAAQLGRWWPFVLMTILSYGLLPRLLLLLLGRWRLTLATGRLICDDPEVLALLDRLATPGVEFVQQDESVNQPSAGSVPAPLDPGLDEQTGIVLWNGAVGETAARTWLHNHLGQSGGPMVELGIWQSESELRSGLGLIPADARRVIVFTKGWEPPLLEFSDFLALLRECVGSKPGITVIPINTTASHVDKADRQVWAQSLSRHDDAGLYVLQSTGGGEPEA